MGVLVACKNEDTFKIESTRVVTTFPRYKYMGIFPDAQGQVTHTSLIRSCRISNPYEILWVPLLSARMKKIQSKMKALDTTLFIYFSDAQGQLTPKSVAESCRNSNSSTLLWLVLLPAGLRDIHV